VLVVGGIFGYKYFTKAKSPEDQIKAVVQREFEYANKSDFSWHSDLECRANQAGDQAQADENRKNFAQIGTVSASVSNIHVTGDTATADVTVTAQKVPDKPFTKSMKFIKEDGKWKECDPDSSSGDDNGDSGN
jgi:Putative lumazine-binding